MRGAGEGRLLPWPRLVGWPEHPNPYSKFFADFSASSFATYNYDALVEFALFRAGRWSPHEGFGVDVAVDVGFTAEPYQLRPSQCQVLHLHGTYLVYSYQHTFSAPDRHGVQWMQRFDEARFAFDPHSLGTLFYPCERSVAGLAYRHELPVRVVAPIPSKAEGLKEEFVRKVTSKAKALLEASPHVVSIGYAFAANDQDSHAGLLEAINSKHKSRVLVVSPEASTIVARLRPRYSRIEWTSQDRGFAEWVEGGYPGLETAV